MLPVMIVPVLSRHDLLDRMIKSINYPIRELVIIDNGAKTHSWEPTWNQWISKIWHLKMPNNLGVAGSWNLGIKSTPMAEYWVISNFDVEWGGDSLKMFQELSGSNKLLLSNGSPEWCAFSVGWKVVDEIGLFDEAFHPAYFEDNDFERRLKNKGNNLEIERSFIPISHENSSTLKSGFQEANKATFSNNESYYREKIKAEDFSQGNWSLQRRRQNSWD
jgi:GT2 family glycosyltransferase